MHSVLTVVYFFARRPWSLNDIFARYLWVNKDKHLFDTSASDFFSHFKVSNITFQKIATNRVKKKRCVDTAICPFLLKRRQRICINAIGSSQWQHSFFFFLVFFSDDQISIWISRPFRNCSPRRPPLRERHGIVQLSWNCESGSRCRIDRVFHYEFERIPNVRLTDGRLVKGACTTN